jgi:hypothetical protein
MLGKSLLNEEELTLVVVEPDELRDVIFLKELTNELLPDGAASSCHQGPFIVEVSLHLRAHGSQLRQKIEEISQKHSQPGQFINISNKTACCLKAFDYGGLHGLGRTDEARSIDCIGPVYEPG